MIKLKLRFFRKRIVVVHVRRIYSVFSIRLGSRECCTPFGVAACTGVQVIGKQEAKQKGNMAESQKL